MRYFLLIIFSVAGTQFGYSQDWELKKEGDSIRVFTRDISGSPIKEFKAEGTIKARCSEIFKILSDVANYPEWIEDVSFAEKLAESDSIMEFYYQIGLPWPIKDRDMALVMDIKKFEDRIHLKLTSNSALVDERSDFIRMHNVVGEWRVIHINDEYSELEYRFLADPEGSLPAWVINLFIVDGPYKTIRNLRDYIKAN